MLKRMVILVSFLSAISVASPSFGGESLTALQTIDNFYKKLLNQHVRRPKLKFSKSFRAEIAKNEEVCKNYSTEICGWAADNDEYLDTQDVDPSLNYKNSGIKLREVSPNTVEVKLNVYPSAKDDGDYKTITFKMVKEGGNWVADDIVYEKEGSSREMMKKENAFNIANPDPDSKAAKK